MKKFIFSLSMIAGLGFTSMAQNMPLPVEPNVTITNEVKMPVSGSTFSKSDISSWYLISDMAKGTNIGGQLKSNFTFMYSDTNAKMLYSDGTVDNAFWMSMGHVLDPKDDALDNTNNPGIKLFPYIDYTFDSIYLPFSYVRHVDSISDGQGGMIPVVDTLYVYYLKGTNIRKTFFTGGSQNKTAISAYNHDAKTSGAFYTVDTILLTKADSNGINNTNGFEASFTIGGIQIAPKVPITVNTNNGADTNNLVGVHFVYKSMVPTITNSGADTIYLLLQQDPANFPNTKRGNSIGFQYQYNGNTANRLENPKFYNISQFMPAWNGYGQNANWKNFYVAGNGFQAELFLNCAFHLTTTTGNVGIADIKNDAFAMSSIYPNPARSSEKPVVAFNLAKSATVSVSIMNLLGQEVKGGFNKSLESGSHVEFIDVAGLKPGVYMVNMTVNGSTISKKLNIVE